MSGLAVFWKAWGRVFPPCRRRQANTARHMRAGGPSTAAATHSGRCRVVNALFCVRSKKRPRLGRGSAVSLATCTQAHSNACVSRQRGREARRRGGTRREVFGQRGAPSLPFCASLPTPPARAHARPDRASDRLGRHTAHDGTVAGGGRWTPRRRLRAHRACPNRHARFRSAAPSPPLPPFSPGHQSPQSRAACPTATAATCRPPPRRPASWPRLGAG